MGIIFQKSDYRWFSAAWKIGLKILPGPFSLTRPSAALSLMERAGGGENVYQ
jgi:hypothetical protein